MNGLKTNPFIGFTYKYQHMTLSHMQVIWCDLMLAAQEIEKQFLASWDFVEEHYRTYSQFKGWEFMTAMQPFIAELRQLGYDRKLRAGQSLWLFVLSRAYTNSIGEGFHTVQIKASDRGSMIVLVNKEGHLATLHGIEHFQQYNFGRIAVNDMLIDLLDDLASQPIQKIKRKRKRKPKNQKSETNHYEDRRFN